MSRSRFLLTLPLALALACVAAPASATELAYRAALDGEHNIPEPLKTPAKGSVELRVTADGKAIAYKVAVEKLANVTAADVHLGSSANNGPLVVKLWPHGSESHQGEFNGVLVEGTFTAADLVGPLTGAPLSDLIEELESGNAYVNLHTSDGVDPPNSGPGDYRLGELRGQLDK